MYKIFLLLLSTIILSCEKETNISSRQVFGKKGTIEIIDSIVFNTSVETEIVLGYQDGQYLGITKSVDKVLIWDSKGEKLHTYPIVGTGPEKISKIDKVGFGSEKKVTLLDRSRLFTLSEEGEIEKVGEIKEFKQSFPFPLYASPLKHLTNNKVVYTSLNDNFSSDDPIFFKKSHGLTCFDVEKSHSELTGFFEENSVYRNHLFPNEFQPEFDIFQDSIYFIRPLDHEYLQVSTCDSKQAIKIPIELDYSTDLYIVNDVGLENQMKVMQLNTLVKSLSVNDSLIVVQYERAQDIGSYTPDIVSLNETPTHRKQFMSVYDRKSRNKLCADIRIPSMLFKVIHVTHEGIFHVSRRYGYGNEATVVYRIKANY